MPPPRAVGLVTGRAVHRDLPRSAFALPASGGAAASVPVPACTLPPTTSSDFDASGRMLGIVDGGISVATTDPSRAFGRGL